MRYSAKIFYDLGVRVRVGSFEGTGAGEHHVMLECTDPGLDAATQYAGIESALGRVVSEMLPVGTVLVMKRYLASDAVNQATLPPCACEQPVAVSMVQQPPIGGTKVAMWAWLVQGARMIPGVGGGENSIVMERGAYRHILDMQMHSHDPETGGQTRDVFNRYIGRLEKQGCTLEANALRTWIFVQGVDTNYAGMVKARKKIFDAHGLTENTHYIASTGIEGKYIHPETAVVVDAYALGGIAPGQMRYLKGATHLSPTHRYGVTFERATAVDYGDRTHVWVSGTASIDNQGAIVHPGDVLSQARRTFDNIGVLLAEGDAGLADVSQMIVYLRDTADHDVVSGWLDDNYPDVPRVVVWAPVCRPGWLIEVECIAIARTGNAAFEPF